MVWMMSDKEYIEKLEKDVAGYVEAIKALPSAMEMSEKRESGQFHIQQKSDAKAMARKVLDEQSAC